VKENPAPQKEGAPSANSPEAHGAVFAPTRWTLVLRARGETVEARAALSELCDGYYRPVFRFLRREGRDEDSARELTQEFFARLLSRGELGQADPSRGRFRSYLLGAVKHFLADQGDYDHRQKRGRGATPESLDAPGPTDTSPALQIADPTGPTPDTFFDREWAFAVMDRALQSLAAEFNGAGKTDQFAALKPWLVGDTAALPQSEAAARLGLSESAIKVTIHRLRKRFREVIRAEIAQTVGDPSEVDTELRYLVEVLAQG
jgi:RNA polymerase sigma-70 factor (ECF subfamily)